MQVIARFGSDANSSQVEQELQDPAEHELQHDSNTNLLCHTVTYLGSRRRGSHIQRYNEREEGWLPTMAYNTFE
jgi:hypothetical protein